MDKPTERTVIWDEAGDCWRDKMTGVDVKGMARPLFNGGQPWVAPSQPDNDAMWAATMSPETERHYLHEQLAHVRRELEITQDMRNKESQRISDYIATIKTLVELRAHHWL